MKNSTIVKIRRNPHNEDTMMGVPHKFKKAIEDIDFFECSIKDKVLIFKPVMLSNGKNE
jgi:hypothetical protein